MYMIDWRVNKWSDYASKKETETDWVSVEIENTFDINLAMVDAEAKVYIRMHGKRWSWMMFRVRLSKSSLEWVSSNGSGGSQQNVCTPQCISSYRRLPIVVVDVVYVICLVMDVCCVCVCVCVKFHRRRTFSKRYIVHCVCMCKYAYVCLYVNTMVGLETIYEDGLNEINEAH